jgi:hypothetical protein
VFLWIRQLETEANGAVLNASTPGNWRVSEAWPVRGQHPTPGSRRRMYGRKEMQITNKIQWIETI